jgi:hypothetical protein
MNGGAALTFETTRLVLGGYLRSLEGYSATGTCEDDADQGVHRFLLGQRLKPNPLVPILKPKYLHELSRERGNSPYQRRPFGDNLTVVKRVS